MLPIPNDCYRSTATSTIKSELNSIFECLNVRNIYSLQIGPPIGPGPPDVGKQKCADDKLNGQAALEIITFEAERRTGDPDQARIFKIWFLFIRP